MILGHDLGAWKRKKNYRQMSRNVNKGRSLFIAWGGGGGGGGEVFGGDHWIFRRTKLRGGSVVT